MTDTRTLREALEETYRKRWAGTRSEKTTMSQAEAAAAQVAFEMLPQAHNADKHDWRLDSVRVHEVGAEAIQKATATWYKVGRSPATINKRLNCLSAMGISVQGQRVKEPKVLKWWLRPEAEKEVVEWLWSPQGCAVTGPNGYLLGDLIIWTTRTGLRIEESLRLRMSDFGPSEVTVPGLKTAGAQATLAVGAEAMAAAARAFERSGGRELTHYPVNVFGLTYEQAKDGWTAVRKQFGFDNPTATLKALRRSAARHLHYDLGMPLDMVRQYLRHEDIETTMGYLRLTGGVSLEEQRRYLR